jgi:hypothetical protein
MHNHHAGLSQLPADQRITDRHDQAAPARLARSGRRLRRCRRWLTHGWWQQARWPGVATQPAGRHPHPVR